MSDTSVPRRFQGIERLYGLQQYGRISQSHIVIIGLGGVGSWSAEALVRSGIAELTLIDLDHVAESNINRQLHATDSTLGMAKVLAMKNRLLDINPKAKISLIEEFISVDNISLLLPVNAHFVIDCIDNFRAKAALIYYCKRNRLPLVTTGGAGGRTDPGRIEQADLSRSEGDALLAKCRKTLRQQYGFPKNIKRRFDIPCIYSTEQPSYPAADGEICRNKKESVSTSGLSCSAGLGSSVTVTATFGFSAAAYVLNRL